MGTWRGWRPEPGNALAGLAATILLAGCGGSIPRSTPAGDPTPLAKCKVAANASSPLVTEWPASEKAHLSSLATAQTVAVSYSGCEMRIIDGCKLEGGYQWVRTTTATDQVEIANADELYAKLPLGALSLEGELERAGRLAVSTTVAGQLTSTGAPPKSGVIPGVCGGHALHQCHQRRRLRAPERRVDRRRWKRRVAGVGVGARSRRKEVVLREAGNRASCDDSTDDAPHRECASPIQVFLRALGSQSNSARYTAGSRPTRQTNGSDPSHDPGNPPRRKVDTSRSRRRHRLRRAMHRVDPAGEWLFPGAQTAAGRDRRAAHPEAPPRGAGRRDRVSTEEWPTPASPRSRSLAWASQALGSASAWNLGSRSGGCEEDPNDLTSKCFPDASFLFLTSGMFLAIAGVSTWWYFYSDWERFRTEEKSAIGLRKRPKPNPTRVGIGPGFVAGQF